MKNILINIIKNKYFLTILKKIFKRFEKDTSIEAKMNHFLKVFHKNSKLLYDLYDIFLQFSNVLPD